MGRKLGAAGKRKLLNTLSKQTIEEALQRLDEFGICNVLRPTGFGKSFMLAKITGTKKKGSKSGYRYNRCLYIYPLDVIKEDVSYQYGPGKEVSLHNTDFISYYALNLIRNRGKEVKVNGVKQTLDLTEFISQYDLVMCDECHLCGAEGFRACWEIIKGLFGPDKIHLIGVTASPDRMDSFDVIGEIFGGTSHGVFPFSIADAYDMNLMERPIYVLGVYDKDAFKNSVMESFNTYMTDPSAEKELARKVDKIDGAERVIKEKLRQYCNTTEYMKFIVFYVDKEDMLDKKDMVKEWFINLFPGKTITEYNIISTNFETTSSVDVGEVEDMTNKNKIHKISVLNELGHKADETVEEKNRVDNTIDIINCIDMLNMGYHVDDITGIIMLRNTRSQIIYTQQLGRCQSVKSSKAPIIFDFVNNCMTKMWFKKDAAEKKGLPDKITLSSEPTERNINNFGEDVVMDRGLEVLDAFIAKITQGRALRGKQAKLDDTVFWYRDVKAPLYVLAYMDNKSNASIEDVERILNYYKVDVEYEDNVLNAMTELDRRNFEYLKTKVSNPDGIKLKLSKRVANEEV